MFRYISIFKKLCIFPLYVLHWKTNIQSTHKNIKKLNFLVIPIFLMKLAFVSKSQIDYAFGALNMDFSLLFSVLQGLYIIDQQLDEQNQLFNNL